MRFFLKIGTRIINADHISAADLDAPCEEEQEKNCVEISLINSEVVYFYGEEADSIRKFLESSNRTYDIKKMYQP